MPWNNDHNSQFLQHFHHTVKTPVSFSLFSNRIRLAWPQLPTHLQSCVRHVFSFFLKTSLSLCPSLFTPLHPPHYPQKPRASQSSTATSVWTPWGEADLSCCLNHKYLSSVEALRPFTCHQLPKAPIRLHLHRLNYYNSFLKLKRLFFFPQML